LRRNGPRVIWRRSGQARHGGQAGQNVLGWKLEKSPSTRFARSLRLRSGQAGHNSLVGDFGAVERTRTSTVLLPPAPQAGASASSATTAQWKQHHSIRERRRSQDRCNGKTNVFSVAPKQVVSLPESAAQVAGPPAAARRVGSFGLAQAPEVLQAWRASLQASSSAPAWTHLATQTRPAPRPYPCAGPVPSHRA
jgi:hypothetical protein